MNLCECAKYPEGTEFESKDQVIVKRGDVFYWLTNGSLVIAESSVLTSDWQRVPHKLIFTGKSSHICSNDFGIKYLSIPLYEEEVEQLADTTKSRAKITVEW